MSKLAWLASAALVGGFLLAGCGANGRSDETVALASHRRAIGSSAPFLTTAQIQSVRSAARTNGFVREVASGSEIRVSRKVVPSMTSGGQRLIGGVVQVQLTPPVRVVDQRLPGVIYPNEKAPPGTPTLHRHALLSGSKIDQLEVVINLKSDRAEQIEPSGDDYEVTKLELIGPPPENPAYAPEPGR